MRQVEEFHERRAKLRLAVARVAGGEELPADHDLEEVEAVNFAEDFPEVPLRLIERIPGKVRWDPALVQNSHHSPILGNRNLSLGRSAVLQGAAASRGSRGGGGQAGARKHIEPGLSDSL